MKSSSVLRWTAAAALGVGMTLAGSAWAGAVTEKGEIVDTSCYLTHGAKGAKHKECATKCIKGGAPMGLLTEKGEVFLLLPDHDNGDPYEKAKDLAAETVTVKGDGAEKAGIHAIVVKSIEKTK